MNTISNVQQTQSIGLLNLEAFELSQRIAKMLSTSSLVPEQYRQTIKVKAGKDADGNMQFREEANPNGLANCVIALNMASRLNADPLMVMQNLYLIEGRPAWSSQFIMAAINSCGRFSALRFDIQDLGEKEVEYTETVWENRIKKTVTKKIKVKNMSCVAFAVERETGERIESSKITIEMAVKEGWFTKNGSKWQTMPEQMLRYRAASFFGRVYAPELLMGLRSSEEEQERVVIDVTPVEKEGSKINVAQFKRKILAAKTIDELDDLTAQLESDGGNHGDLEKLINAQVDKLAPKSSHGDAVVETITEEVHTPVEDERHELYAAIDNASNLNEIKAVGKQVMQAERDGLNSGIVNDLKNYYAQRKTVLEKTLPDESINSILNELENSGDIDQLNTILATRFEPFTAQITDQQIDQINAVYERKEAELTA
jgi:hypothetical protein